MNNKPAPLNIIWLTLILTAIVIASYKGTMAEVTKASFESAKNAVNLALSLVGAMALWLGIIKVAEESGLMKKIGIAIRPLMLRLFPEVPPDHPAMSAMIMNLAANALGLGNAATPMGIKAMQELDKLNHRKGTASNAMCLFLAINTSSITLLPLSVITIRAAAGVSKPADILIPTLIASFFSTGVAIIMAKILAKPEPFIEFNQEQITQKTEDAISSEKESTKPGMLYKMLLFFLIILFCGAIIRNLIIYHQASFFSLNVLTSISDWLIPVLMATFLIIGYLKGIRVYEVLTDGAKEGFDVAVRIIPFMVAIFVAIGMFRASGAMDLLKTTLAPITTFFGIPPEAFPMALLRTLSGSGAFGLMSEIINRDPNSFLSYLVSVIQGSSETTFYVLAVYFGSIGIRDTRHGLPAALCADAAGLISSVVICRLMYHL
ncbi:MAG: spore maturation protein [Desulfobacterales bacterium]|nr:spore maturation protein [Desulfobacterales bacterium]